MAGRDLSRLCQAVLPPEFQRLKSELPRIQAFLDANLPEAVRDCVTVLSVNAESVVIAANSPMVANYLRLHSAEIRQQLREGLRMEQEIRFRTVPDALLRAREREPLHAPKAVGAETVDAIRRNAQWIEDAALRDALLALADSLAAKREEN